MKVSEVMTEEVKGVSVPGNRDNAMELIRKLEVSALPVLKEDTKELAGIIRLRDFFEKPDENQIAMLMNRDIVTINPDDSLEAAADTMLENNVRRIPVVNEDKELFGIITVRDILSRVILEREEETEIKDCMQNTVSTLWKETPLDVALEIIHLSGKRALPVLDDRGELVGMIGDKDIMTVSDVEEEEIKEQMSGKSETEKWAWDSEDTIYITKRSLKPPEKSVKEVMTKDLITVTKRSEVQHCAKLMEENNLNQIPVLSGKNLIGIVSDEDLLKALNS